MWLSQNILLVSSVDSGINKITAFNIESRQLLWERVSSFSSGGGHFFAGFESDKKTVFLLTEKGETQKLEAMTGKVLGVGNKKIRPSISNVREPWAATPGWKQMYMATVNKPNKLRRYDPWTGELHFESALLSGANIAVGLHPQKEIGFCLSSRSGQGYALEVFDQNSGESREILPFLAKSLAYGSSRLQRAKIRLKEERVAALLFDKIVVWGFRVDTLSRTYKGSGQANSARIIGDRDTLVFTSNGERACLRIQDTGELHYGEIQQEIELAATAKSYFVNLLSANADGSRILTGRNGFYSAHSLTDKGLSLLWNRRLRPGYTSDPFVVHPREDLCWTGGAVVEFSSGKVLTEVNRAGINMSGDDLLKVDWVGSDRVVEIVKLEDSDESENGDISMLALRLWNTQTGEPVATKEAFHAVAVSTSPDGRWIAEAGDDKRLRLHQSRTLSVERDVRVHDKGLTSVAWHPTLPLIVTTAKDGKVRIWNLSDFKMEQEYRLFGDFVGEARVSANGKNLYIRSGAKMAILTPECF
jgi:hypothetical protein